MPFGVFKSWFQKFEPRVIHDEKLGELKSTRSGDWVATIHVENLQDPIPVELCGVNESPDQRQLEFVKEIQTKFPEIWARLRTTLFKDLDAFGEEMTMEEFFDLLDVTSIAVQSPTEHAEWEISAVSPIEDHLFTIYMRDFTDCGFSMDG